MSRQASIPPIDPARPDIEQRVWRHGCGGLWAGATAMINGPQREQRVEAQRASDIAQENRTLCGELGMPPDTLAFDRCTSILTQVRQRQEERWMWGTDIGLP